MIDSIGSVRAIEGFAPVTSVAPTAPVSFDVSLAPLDALPSFATLEVPADACTSTPCGQELIRVAMADLAVDHQAVSAEVLRHTVSAYAVYRQFRLEDKKRPS